MNFDSGIVLKELLSLLGVVGVEIDADDFSVVGFECGYDFFEWGAGAASDIEEVVFEHGHVMKHCNVGGDGEECADEEVVDEDGDFFNKAEHVLNRVKILKIVGKDFVYTLMMSIKWR